MKKSYKSSINGVGPELVDFINEQNPIDEDIGILDEYGGLSGVVITRDAYEFF